MAPSTLDLFILTFNCAKNLIEASVFASHLHGALLQNGTGLPDLVVFSLQEVAPISYSFIGSYFLSPYYARFGEALNLASERLLASTGADDGEDASAPMLQTGARPQGGRTAPYTLVRAKNVGMTAILLYARDPIAIRTIEEAECGFGAADMGNKGAVGLRVTLGGQRGDDGTEAGAKTTELTFVAAHLAAMEWNLKKRNSNWRTIVSGLTFANPRSILPGIFPEHGAGPTPDRSGAGDTAPPPRLYTGDSPDPSEEEEASDEDEQPLLSQQQQQQQQQQQTPPDSSLSPSQRAALQSISIYKPSSHLFVAGDLNYRISSTTPPPLAPFPSFDPSSEHHYPSFLPRDQLTRERLANRTLHGLAEAPIAFGPTYKFDILPSPDGGSSSSTASQTGTGTGTGEVPWRFAPHRWPSWCDRVLYLDVPRWVALPPAAATTTTTTTTSSSSSVDGKTKVQVEVKAYDALPVVASSDHRGVFFRARVPVLAEAEMTPPPELEGEEYDHDPRVRMPVPVDVHAWERRAAARRREKVVGWSALLWSTREGAVLLATVVALGVGGWWLWRVW
ncbi:Endonuclease/exonuclease/phosphatase [Chaetomium strumarium]|uniref:Endonuclease/exonuclease/phosphatase n=1 Tax=Chaetomium strumarium TaxID=1170767 RepID=A0AAJ0H2X0_9PEZI|nr:Endonuclease/exonuclease/phosphatase [Chaetomium strumarium]